MELTNEQILENVKTIHAYINEKLSDPNKTTLKTLFDGEVGELFFTSPASSNTAYHLAVPGGLAQHCLNVYNAFVKLNTAFQCGFSDEDMFLCSILHDLGKTCTPDMKGAYYKDQTNDWLKKKGEVYERDNSKGYLTNRDRTSFLLQAFGIKLNFEQFQALLISDGWFSEQNKSYNNQNAKLALFMHFADFIATTLEKD